MQTYELVLGGGSIAALVETIAERAHRVAPVVSRADAAEVLRVMLAPRLHVSDRMLLLECDDVRDLPKIFAAALADRSGARHEARSRLESGLAAVLERVLAPLVIKKHDGPAQAGTPVEASPSSGGHHGHPNRRSLGGAA